MKDAKYVVYLSCALGMLIYAVPRLDVGGGWTLPTVFAAVWILFALLVISAYLHYLMGVDEEMKKELTRVKRMKRWQLEQRIARLGRRKGHNEARNVH